MLDCSGENSAILKHRSLKLFDGPGKAETPLDRIFKWCDHPYDGCALAQFWLTSLQEEGVDVMLYLHEEEDLHLEPQNTIPTAFIGKYLSKPRKLDFQYGPSPMVTWEWWIDPASAGALVCHEFRNLNSIDPTYWYYDDNFWK